MTVIENPPCWSAKESVDIAAGAQTERRGGAGAGEVFGAAPYGALLGGKDLTGCFYSTIQRSEVSSVGS